MQNPVLIYATLSEERDIQETSRMYIMVATVSTSILAIALFFRASRLQQDEGIFGGVGIPIYGILVAIPVFLFSMRRRWILGLLVSGLLFMASAMKQVCSEAVFGGDSSACTWKAVILVACIVNGVISVRLRERFGPQAFLLSRQDR